MATSHGACPKRLHLGAHVIPIRWHHHYLACDEDNAIVTDCIDDGDLGMMTLTDAWIIHISERSPDQPITVLHEALHAAMRTTGGYRLLDGREDEEAIVTGFSEAVVELLRRNPGLSEYLTGRA